MEVFGGLEDDFLTVFDIEPTALWPLDAAALKVVESGSGPLVCRQCRLDACGCDVVAHFERGRCRRKFEPCPERRALLFTYHTLFGLVVAA